jgi:hypothetical protein
VLVDAVCGGAPHNSTLGIERQPMALDPAPRRELHWSPKEKSLARAAFDHALARENASIRTEVERLLQGTSEANAVWDVLEFLSSKQRNIQQKYDYRYSVLIGVFARLLYEGWLSEQDLAGLSPEKVELIRRGAGTTRELDA